MQRNYRKRVCDNSLLGNRIMHVTTRFKADAVRTLSASHGSYICMAPSLQNIRVERLLCQAGPPASSCEGVAAVLPACVVAMVATTASMTMFSTASPAHARIRTDQVVSSPSAGQAEESDAAWASQSAPMRFNRPMSSSKPPQTSTAVRAREAIQRLDLAHAAVDDGNFEEALQQYDTVVQVFGDLALAEYARLGKALMLYQVGQTSAAILQLEDQQVSMRGSAEVHAGLAALLYTERPNQRLRAEQEWDVACEFDKRYSDVIHFFFEYLGRDQYASQEQVLLVPGSITYLLLNSGSELASVMLPDAADKDLVLFAVNNNPCVTYAGGGSHWSLLAWHSPSATFRLYDSLPSIAGCDVAVSVATAVRPALGPRAAQAQVVSVVGMPHQVNGHDCGVYVLAMAGALCKWSSEGADLVSQEEQLLGWLTPARIAQQRTEVLRLVESKM